MFSKFSCSVHSFVVVSSSTSWFSILYWCLRYLVNCRTLNLVFWYVAPHQVCPADLTGTTDQTQSLVLIRYTDVACDAG